MTPAFESSVNKTHTLRSHYDADVRLGGTPGNGDARIFADFNDLGAMERLMQ